MHNGLKKKKKLLSAYLNAVCDHVKSPVGTNDPYSISCAIFKVTGLKTAHLKWIVLIVSDSTIQFSRFCRASEKKNSEKKLSKKFPACHIVLSTWILTRSCYLYDACKLIQLAVATNPASLDSL